MSTEKRASVAKSVVMTAIVSGSQEGLTAQQVADKLGMTKASFVQAQNALRKEHKLLKSNGVPVGDFPELKDGRSLRKGTTSNAPTAAQNAILAALGQVGSVEPESDETEDSDELPTAVE